jgi:hypothetical protein
METNTLDEHWENHNNLKQYLPAYASLTKACNICARDSTLISTSRPSSLGVYS